MSKEENFLKFTGHFVRTIGAFVGMVSAVLLTFTFVIPSMGLFITSLVTGTGITGMAVYNVGSSVTLSVPQTYATASTMFVWMLIGITFLILGNRIIPARKY